ncbi:hypothetical protein GCM10023149_34510 [Mucilaginibacter gynuensis]|uniref:Lipoprotein n=1 Tax=Mucilaginibacter gynuensis TaxID=1302236 RepID=A0ABP8GTI4_9SPHI
MKPIPICLLTLLIVLFNSCKPNSNSEIAAAINAAHTKFPQLIIFGIKDYELIRAVEIEKPAVKIHLYELRHSGYTTQNIIVLSNKKDQFYAVPLPSQRFKSYWNFVYDTSSKPVALKPGTFETEVNYALNKLNLADWDERYHVVSEMLGTAWAANIITAADSNKIVDIGANPLDSCNILARQNYNAIISSIHSYEYRMNVFLGNYIIFHLQERNTKKRKESYIKIKTYRVPCVLDVNPINL